MATKAPDSEASLIEAVCERVRERVPAEQRGSCEAFVRDYFRWVAPEDLDERDPLDLYGAALAHWNLAQERQPGGTLVRVYNPQLDQHGWQSRHTVIELVTEDMPFLVDSITLALVRARCDVHLIIHPVLHARRDGEGHLLSVGEDSGGESVAVVESVIHVEIDREADPERLTLLGEKVRTALEHVRAAVEDWPTMRERLTEAAGELERVPPAVSDEEREEVADFLRWLDEGQFIFLGYREYDLIALDGEDALMEVAGSGRGILRRAEPPGGSQSFARLAPEVRARARLPSPLTLTKVGSRSPVHRDADLDYVGVKRFNADGEVIGEHRFLGLYTTAAFRASARTVPILKGRIERIRARAGFPAGGHSDKALVEILETFPRDELVQIDEDELYAIATGVLALADRPRVRLFAWRDPFDRHCSCLIYVPRERYNTESRERVQRVLHDAFGTDDLDWRLLLSESTLVRVHYVLRARPDGTLCHCDPTALEHRIAEATRSWTEDLRDATIDALGEERALPLLRRYAKAFPAAYRADWPARAAIPDIEIIESLSEDETLRMQLYRRLEAPSDTLRCKLFSREAPLALSDLLPIFEHLGLRVDEEHPYEIAPPDGAATWIYDLGLHCTLCADLDSQERRDYLQEAFLGVWRGELEDDQLGTLVLAAGLRGREIALLRAVGKYLRQAGLSFSQAYAERTLCAHPDIAALLVTLVRARLDPEGASPSRTETLDAEIEAAIDSVASLDEDRILRSFLSVVRAMVRTNWFQHDAQGRLRHYVSFKLHPAQVPLLPRPRPRHEIFVYSPRVEGVHLRGGRVARGGLRWSDRLEDFRTEVQGLMKAQMVKNVLIVPVGAKGGFVVKRPPAEGLRQEVVECYRTFIRGLLDITDNIRENAVVGPPEVLRLDGDDPYLVVAADKGTATFSDIANAISAEYDFWLGDAFASGGSEGYDHKKMGITARGAWESVKRHFRELGIDIGSTDFTVVGIGDMAGDVFGNGMLLSPHIRLVAAFNHMHVFLDPDPDAASSFAERHRLFELPRSTWADYDAKKISEGGGVFARSAKSIPLSPAVRARLQIEEEELAPSELTHRLLCAPVDLLWNGGIGTYVKASSESSADVGDKANDTLRVNGGELRCRVVGEGGNLGFTQRGRIEYALTGGRINTDAIDNAAGVNCSDHEVNIKILLDAVVATQDMTVKQRNDLLVEMTDEVAERVLRDSYVQTQALSLARAQAPQMLDVHARVLRHFEQKGVLDREIEYLPSDAAIAERRKAGGGLTSPELAVMMAYAKIDLEAALLESDLPEDPFLSQDLALYFPPRLREPFAARMREHRLRREIIATFITNSMVHRAGGTFAFRLAEETGATMPELARAYAVAREVFRMREVWVGVEALDLKVEAGVQFTMLFEARKLVERATRWLVGMHRGPFDIAAIAGYYAPGVRVLEQELPDILCGAEREGWDAMLAGLISGGVPTELARRVAGMSALFSALDVVDVANATGRSVEEVAAVYFLLAGRVRLHWLRQQIVALPRADRWQTLARAALREEVYALQRELTSEVLRSGPAGVDADAAIEAWLAGADATVRRSQAVIDDIRASGEFDLTTLPIALRELRALVRSGGPTPAGV
ncbi:MAG TPA: NAD-glutamate dehydrogenase [Solirubrobacteraceae bacterium]|jgi:glutamate dehydrogenase|nr:NAD-glutamate dehydrogenase [Solirubrobacteraceae bacterium]